MPLPHPQIQPIPTTLPEAVPELWNERYTQIDENFEAVDERLLGTEAEIVAGRGGKVNLNARFAAIEKNADHNGVRSVTITANNANTVQDNITNSDMRRIVNYAVTGNGYGHVMLPALASIGPELANSLITICNTGLSDEGQVRIMAYGWPGAGADFIYSKTDPAFYPRGCVVLERGSAVVLVPNPAGNFWWVLNESQPVMLSRVAAVTLNLSANVAANGSIDWTRKRGWLGFQVTKMTGSGPGVYKIDWQDSFWLGGYPQVYVQVVSASDAPAYARVNPIEYNATTQKFANSATVTTYLNHNKTDLDFNVLITVPTANTYMP